MYNKNQIIGGMISSAIIILVISQLSTGSLNPVEVFRNDNLLLKIVVGFLLFSFAVSPILLLYQRGLQDKNCAKCGLSLIDYAGPRGNPALCSKCTRWFHEKCMKENGGDQFNGCNLPPCPSVETVLVA